MVAQPPSAVPRRRKEEYGYDGAEEDDEGQEKKRRRGTRGEEEEADDAEERKRKNRRRGRRRRRAKRAARAERLGVRSRDRSGVGGSIVGAVTLFLLSLSCNTIQQYILFVGAASIRPQHTTCFAMQQELMASSAS